MICRETIPMFRVAMNPNVNDLLLKTLHSGWIGQGEMVKTFERCLSDAFKNENVLTLSSGTHGLTLALRMCDVGPGDEVITTPLTCLSYLSSIETDKGFMPIGKIVNQKLNVKVKSLNRNNNKIEFKEITNWIKLSSDNVKWYMIYLKNGNSSRSKIAGKRHLWITGDHKILTKFGYKRVDELNELSTFDLLATDNKTPNSKQIEFINGTMLGDGHIQKCRQSARLSFCHCKEQKEWIDFKEKALSGFNIYRNSKENKENLQTEINLFFKELRDKWYSKNSKIIPDVELTPLTLATWYMDDGSLGSSGDYLVLSTEGFYSGYFWKLFYKLVDLGFKPTAHKKGKGYYIIIGNGNSYNKHNSFEIFIRIISEYIIPSMRYKLPNIDNLKDFNSELWNLGKSEIYYTEVIAKKGTPPKYHKPKYVYCLEVKDNHNFVSKNMILSNCTATNMPILMQGAKIVWADVKNDLNIDPKSIKSCITNKTKAIIIVHWGGYPCDMDEIEKIAHEGGDIPIIEDCAHAYGANYKAHVIGDCHYSSFAMFSFQAIKHLTCVDGGALCTKEKWSYDKGKLLRWFGIDRESNRKDMRCEEDIKHWGYKFHMNDINAVVGMKNMKLADENIRSATSNAMHYETELIPFDGIEIPQIADNRDSSYWLFTMLVEDRTSFAHMMGSKGIAVSRVHERNDKHTCFRNFKKELPQLEEVMEKMICIPVGWWLSEDDVQYIIRSIKEGW